MAYETITDKTSVGDRDFESDFEMSESASLTIAPYQFEPVCTIFRVYTLRVHLHTQKMSEMNNNIMVKTDELGIPTGGYSKHFI